MSSYPLVFCSPYCGQTLQWKLLSTWGNVSALPDEGRGDIGNWFAERGITSQKLS